MWVKYQPSHITGLTALVCDALNLEIMDNIFNPPDTEVFIYIILVLLKILRCQITCSILIYMALLFLQTNWFKIHVFPFRNSLNLFGCLCLQNTTFINIYFKNERGRIWKIICSFYGHCDIIWNKRAKAVLFYLHIVFNNPYYGTIYGRPIVKLKEYTLLTMWCHSLSFVT